MHPMYDNDVVFTTFCTQDVVKDYWIDSSPQYERSVENEEGWGCTILYERQYE